MPTREKDTYCIRSVENALLLLEALAEEDSKCSLSQLSSKLGMTKASLFRLMATFESHGYVERGHSSSEYKLGLAAFEVGQKLLSRMGLLHKARPVMSQLVRQCNETVYLVIRRDNDALFLEMADNDQKVKVVPLNGRRFPLTSCAAGKALLAFDELNDIPKTEQTPQLEEELKYCRKNGFSVDKDGVGEGSTCIAVPLFNAEGESCGCIAMVGPSFRMDNSTINNQLLPAIKAAGEMASARLGHIGPELKNKQPATANN
ncbi:IclR family transcriptional regulator [Malonomonas rubra]|uniref:IclR family transcriptional regulator n=1 Tax=Malonomonas rubra TaxID=57040 RepID=UPI0026F3481E|nr:IclR family transcriptional regulator [Malonomonas rubra]